MSSFKKLSKSDVTVVPYHANKQWNLSYCPYPTSSTYLTIYKGTNIVNSVFSTENDPVTEGQYERLVYSQINQLYYQDYTIPLNTHSLANSIYYESASAQRPTSSYFIYNDSANLISNFPTGANEGIRVLSVNQNIYGNKLLPGSFILSSSAYCIVDDNYGNLIDLKGTGLQYFVNGFFNAEAYFADIPASADDVHIGNIFYAQGLAIITNQDYQLMFPLPPLAVNDIAYFLTATSPKVVSPLSNDNGRGGTLEPTTLTLSGSASELSYWTNNGDGTITLNTSIVGSYTVYYTVEASYDCGNIISNKAKITAVVAQSIPPTTTTTTTTSTTSTTTTAPTTTSTTSTTTTAPTTTSTTTTTTTAAPTTSTTTTTTTTAPTTSTTTTTTTVAPTTTSTTTTTTTIVSFAFNISAPNTIGVGGTCDLPLNTEPQVYSTENSVIATLGDIIYQNPGLTTPFVGDPTKEYALEYTGNLGLIRIVQIDNTGLVTSVANCY